MAKKVLVNLDLSKNQILNAAFQGLTTAPQNPVVGQFYYDTTSGVNKLKIWDGSAWTVAGKDLSIASASANYLELNEAGTELSAKVDTAVTADSTKLITSGAVKTAIDNAITGGIYYVGTFDLNPSGTAATDYSGLGNTGHKKGELYYVKNSTSSTASVTIGGVEWTPGDYLLINKDVASGSAPLAADVEKIDNTEASDIVRKDATQTLTNKTIDCATSGTGAGNNVITNLGTSAFASSAFVTTIRPASAETEGDPIAVDTAVASEKAIRTALDLISTDVSGKQDKVTTAVENNIATWNASGNTKDSGVSVTTSINASATAVDTKLPSEKAVRTELDKKQDKPTSAVENNIATFDNAKNAKDSGKAFVTTVGAASGEGAATDDQVATALAVRTAIDNAITATKLTAKNTALTPAAGVATWTISNTLATKDVVVTLYEESTGDECFADITVSASNIIVKINATETIAADTYRLVAIA